jgi:hypothetical protein
MGQYHALYNVSKKEMVIPHHLDMGAKLREHTGGTGSMSDATYLLLANSNGRGGGDVEPHPYVGRWAGDAIVVQGDYAEAGDPGYIDDTRDFTNISEGVLDMLRHCGYR